jgi:hypothetical protein
MMILLQQERNIYYVVQVEVFLAKMFSSDPAEDDSDSLHVSPSGLLELITYFIIQGI